MPKMTRTRRTRTAATSTTRPHPRPRRRHGRSTPEAMEDASAAATLRQIVDNHVDGVNGYRVLMSAHPLLMTRAAQGAMMMSVIASLQALGEPLADVVDRVGLAYGTEIDLTEIDSREALLLPPALPA